MFVATENIPLVRDANDNRMITVVVFVVAFVVSFALFVSFSSTYENIARSGSLDYRFS
jgi:hypothetical protein